MNKINKNVPWHILAPSAVACDNLHLRASAHLRHAVPFCFTGSSIGISCETKKAAAPHARDRQPALPPKLASACRGNSPLISVNAGSTLYLTMQSFRSNPDLRDLSCPLRHFPSLAQSSEAGSTTRTWKLSPSASSLGCRHSSTFPLQCLSDMYI